MSWGENLKASFGMMTFNSFKSIEPEKSKSAAQNKIAFGSFSFALSRIYKN